MHFNSFVNRLVYLILVTIHMSIFLSLLTLNRGLDYDDYDDVMMMLNLKYIK